MSTSGSSIADEVELPEDLSGSVDIEHDVDASEDVAASRGDATSDQGEEVPRVVMNEVPRDDGPMRPDLIVGPPPEPTPVVEDEVSGEDRSEEEAYSDEFHEEDVVPEEVDETPVASVTAEEADPSEELPGTRDDTYGDDFEEYGDDDDVSAARSTPSPPARDPPTSPASQPLRSLGTPSPESSPPRDDDDGRGPVAEPEPAAARRLGAHGRFNRDRTRRTHRRRLLMAPALAVHRRARGWRWEARIGDVLPGLAAEGSPGRHAEGFIVPDAPREGHRGQARSTDTRAETRRV